MNCNNKEKAASWIQRLNLYEHPEGGYYRETYRSDRVIELDVQKGKKEQENKDEKFKSSFSSSSSPRSISSTIYYLLKGGQISALHRLKSADEIWHFYAGSSLTIYIIEEERTRKLGEFRLGNSIEGCDMFQLVVRRGSWFGAIVNDPSSYSLVGCTVSPAFDFEDFELGQRENLVNMYPEYKQIIEKLTRR
jgi:predicted cupin superfamily sugar epimerase